ncbi:YIP1 family protein [Candidatus Woesearchaeota archaeon]|nr:YIP1 family protein [Candidatus Woesearchaeota archaeon]
MVSEQLIAYVKSVLAQGFSEAEVKQGLLKSGYSEADADAALGEVLSARTMQSEAPAGYFGRLKEVLFSPAKFFESVKEEQGVGKPLLFVVISSAIVGVLLSVMLFVFFGFLIGLAAEGGADVSSLVAALSPLLVAAVLFVGSLVFSIVGSFVFAGLFHISVKLLGGKGSFVQTYKALAYSSGVFIPGMVLMFIPFVGSIATSVWAIVLFVIGVSALHDLSRLRALVSWLLLSVVLGILFVVFAMFAGFLLAMLMPVPEYVEETTAPSYDALANIPPPPVPGAESSVQQATSSDSGCVERDGQWCFSGAQGEGCGSRDDCLAYVAVDTQNPAVCEQLSDEQHDICLGTLAINMKQRDLCNSASDQPSCFQFYDTFAASS